MGIRMGEPREPQWSILQLDLGDRRETLLPCLHPRDSRTTCIVSHLEKLHTGDKTYTNLKVLLL